MAVTNIHSIKTNLSGAISYIIDPDKTVNGLYVTSYLCRDDSRGAAEDFAKARQRGTGRTKILAHHIIQSFKPDEITPEQALAVSEELCDRFLKGRYQYVLAIHTDHDHIHAHIIFNNVNAYNGLSFTYEENQGKVKERSWAKLRAVSDEICNEHRLSVIAESEKSTGVSHYERDMQIEGKSWKEKLRNRLAKIILKSDSFEDFLRRCDKKNIEIVYAPTHKHKLKYRMEGQERFIRGETLGEFYTADTIMEQIEAIKKINKAKQLIAEMSKPRVAETPKPQVQKTPEVKPLERTVAPTPPIPEVKPSAPIQHVTEVKPTAPIPDTKPTEKKIDVWADIRGMDRVDEMIQALEKVGITSYDELSFFMMRSSSKHPQDHRDEIKAKSERIEQLKMLIEYMQQRECLNPIHTEYENKSGWFKTRYEKKHHDELNDYNSAVSYIKKHIDDFKGKDGKTPTLKDLQGKLKRLKAKLKSLEEENAIYEVKARSAYPYVKKIRQYHYDMTNKREREKSYQRTHTQQKKKDIIE